MCRAIKCVVKKMLHGEGFPGCLASIYVVVWIIYQGLGHLSYQSVCRFAIRTHTHWLWLLSPTLFLSISLFFTTILWLHTLYTLLWLYIFFFWQFSTLSALSLTQTYCRPSVPDLGLSHCFTLHRAQQSYPPTRFYALSLRSEFKVWA